MAAAFAGCAAGGEPRASSASSSSAASAKSSSSSTANGGALRLMTGGQSGTYCSFGGVLARHATDHAGIAVTALLSEGSRENVESLANGEAELCFCQSDVMRYAYEGTGLFEGMPFDSLRAVAALYDEPVQIVARDPGIKSVADLKGRRVSVGAPYSGVNFNALDILGVCGTGIDDITETYESFGDSAASLKEGRIDAAFFVAGAPADVVRGLLESEGAHLVPLGKKHVKELVGLSPSYSEATIPAGTYPRQGKGIATVAVQAAVLASSAVSSRDVYAFVKDVFDAAEDEPAAAAHEMYRRLSVEKGASLAGAPYHPGAAKFFEEKGLIVETE